MKDNREVFAAIGRETLGPLLHSFALWLHEQARRDGAERLFFLARDGYMMQQAYRAAIPEAERIPNQYMYASRRLLNFPAIKQIDDKSLHLLMGDRVAMPVEQYLRRIGLDRGEFTAELREAGFHGPTQVVRQRDWPKLRRLFELLERQIVLAAEQERRLVLRYADSLADWDLLKCGVVDIGWHGSLQESLREVLELPSGMLHGYYFGLHASAGHTGERMKAYLDERRAADVYSSWRTFRRCREIFEVFFTGREGSIIGLNETAPGVFEATKEAYVMPAEKAGLLDLLQGEALDSIKNAQREPKRGEVLRRLRRLLSRPTRAEAEALGDIPHMEGFGGYGRMAPLARPRHRLRHYLRRPGSLMYEFRKTFWRPGFIARLKY
jgi:hypothetical protein